MSVAWSTFGRLVTFGLLGSALVVLTPTQASTVSWTDWNSATAGSPGTADGTIGS
jgi:hypothetical protein